MSNLLSRINSSASSQRNQSVLGKYASALFSMILLFSSSDLNELTEFLIIKLAYGAINSTELSVLESSRATKLSYKHVFHLIKRSKCPLSNSLCICRKAVIINL